MSPNYGSSKFFISVLVVVLSFFLAMEGADIPEGVFIAAVVGYNAANAYIKGRNGGGTG